MGGQDPDPGGSGGAVTPGDDCARDGEAALVLGQGAGRSYVPLEAGDRVDLEFGSQAGMEAPLSVRTVGLDPDSVGAIEVELLVDGAPIGRVDEEGEEISCEREWGQIDVPLLVDVVGHPTVVSVAQLNGREAQFVATFEREGDEPITGSIVVTLGL